MYLGLLSKMPFEVQYVMCRDVVMIFVIDILQGYRPNYLLQVGIVVEHSENGTPKGLDL